MRNFFFLLEVQFLYEDNVNGTQKYNLFAFKIANSFDLICFHLFLFFLNTAGRAENIFLIFLNSIAKFYFSLIIILL